MKQKVDIEVVQMIGSTIAAVLIGIAILVVAGAGVLGIAFGIPFLEGVLYVLLGYLAIEALICGPMLLCALNIRV